MFATIFTALAVTAASAVVGQAILALLGRQRISSLAPVLGLAALYMASWWAVQLPGEGTAAIIAVAVITGVSGWFVWTRRVWNADRAWNLSIAALTAVIALALSTIPFLVAVRFGILGTSLNPDMSQHLYAAYEVSVGGSERLIESGYPLGPHALAAAFTALGVSLVHAFSGLTVAIAIVACIAPLTLLRNVGPRRQVVGALLIGLSYMFAAALVQGSFKEMSEAVFLLGTGIAAVQLTQGRLLGPGSRPLLAGIPFAVISIGVVYTYSWPGLLWIWGGLAVWALILCVIPFNRERRSAEADRKNNVLDADGRPVNPWRAGLRGAIDVAKPWLEPVALGAVLFVVAVIPEVPRMIEFARFETFAPAGAGLGNLFGSLSPFLVLGVWPSGDFRVEPGDGAAPALFFIIGVTLALWIFYVGVRAELRERQYALIGMAAAAILLWLYAQLLGTPYQAAKALTVAAPLVMLISVTGFIGLRPGGGEGWGQLLRIPAAAAFVFAAALSTLLILGNGPVGPDKWSPLLNQIRPLDEPVVVSAPEGWLDGDHGADITRWELRGGEVCVVPENDGDGVEVIPGSHRYVVVVNADDSTRSGAPALGDAELVASDSLYQVFRYNQPIPGGGEPCPFIPDGANTSRDNGS